MLPCAINISYLESWVSLRYIDFVFCSYVKLNVRYLIPKSTIWNKL